MVAVRTFIVREGIIALIDDIHTATSSIIAWMAKKRGAYIVGITSEKTEIPSSICDVIVRKDSKTLVQDVINGCKGIGAHLYIPSLNPTPIDQVLQMLTTSAVIVDHIGSMNDISISKLMQKSLFLTAPSVSDYKSLKTELVLTFDEVIAMMQEKPLKISFTEYNFDQINEAFLQVSSSKISSAVVIKL
jgi:D-arabinose 1-dehydrogenase-like Zn-dependent alcohol dehydrogenase